MIQETITSADIYAHVRSVMKPEDREQADIERAFYDQADRFDALAAEARQLLDAMRAVAA